MNLGQKIKQLRLSRGETMEEFGNHFGANKSNVWTWENNRSSPTPMRIKKMSKLAGVSVSEFTRETNNSLSEYSEEELLKELLRRKKTPLQRCLTKLSIRSITERMLEINEFV